MLPRSAPTRPWHTLMWRIPVAASAALALAAALGTLVLGLGGLPVANVNDPSPQLRLGLALIPALGLVLAACIGMACGVSVVAVLVRDTLDTQRPDDAVPGLWGGWSQAWRSLHRVAVLGVAGLVLTVLSVLVSFPVMVLVLARAAWRALPTRVLAAMHVRMENRARRSPREALWLAVPFATTAIVLVAVPLAWAALLDGVRLRSALVSGLQAGAVGPTVTRLKVLGGVVLVVLVGVGTTAGAGLFAGSSIYIPALGVATALAIAVTGVLIGLLATGWSSSTVEPRSDDRSSRFPGLRRAQVSFIRPRPPWRRVGTAAMLIVTLLIPTALSAVSGVAVAASASASGGGDIVIDTLNDASVPAAGECVQANLPCGVRAALAEAAQQTAGGGSARVTFAVNGTIHLAQTLDIGSGTTLDADGHSIVLDAHQDFRALQTFIAQESEGGSVTLRGLIVTGGRSESGGAGVFSDAVNVRLEQVTFSDNISDAGSADLPPLNVDGGAVSAPYGLVTVTESTFVDNHARSGVGGAVAAGRLSWTNSTAVGNDGVDGRPEGGAVYVAYGGAISHATVLGGGVSGSEDTNITVVNSAIQTYSATFPCARITGTSDPDAPSVGNVDPQGTCLGTKKPVAPFGALSDNGGPTKTVALFPGSAAIGAADPTHCAATDQRGHARPAGACDAGAFQTLVADVPLVHVTLSAAPAPDEAILGDQTTLRADLSSAAALPPGTVRFLDGTDVLVSGIAVNAVGHAETTLTSLAQGPRKLSAEFVPDNGSATATSPVLTLPVRAGVPLKVTSSAPTQLHHPTTITVLVQTPNDQPGVPAPSGTAHFDAGILTGDADVVDGIATWQVSDLPQAQLDVKYSGDAYHREGEWLGLITNTDLTTTTTMSVAAAAVSFGEPFTIEATVRDNRGPVTGTADLYIDGNRTTGTNLIGGVASFITDQLSPGQHTMHVVAVPKPGWAQSSSTPMMVSVTPASATASLDAPTQRTYDDPAFSPTVTVNGAGAVGATVRLIDGATILATAITGDRGTATFTVPRLTLNAGTHNLLAEVVPSDRTSVGRSNVVVLTVGKVQSAVTATPGPAKVEQPASIVVSGSSWATAGTLALLTDTGTVLATGSLKDSSGRLTWTPRSGGATALQVVFTPTDALNVLPATQAVEVTVAAAATPTPTLSWTPVPVADGTYLSVDFGIGAPGPALSGQVHLVRDGSPVSTAALDAGHASLKLDTAAIGHCYTDGELTLAYDSDPNHETTSTPVPPVCVPKFTTITTIGALDPLVYQGALRLAATVTAPASPQAPAGAVEFFANGLSVGTGTVAPDGTAALDSVTSEPGPLTITARYTAGPGVNGDSTAKPVTTTVSQLVAPIVTLSAATDALAAAKVGVPLTLRANVSRPPGAASLDPAGVRVYDQTGTLIGSARWSTGFLTYADIAVTPVHGGAGLLTARFYYGRNFAEGASEPLRVAVAGYAPSLRLEQPPNTPTVGAAFSLHVLIGESIGAQGQPVVRGPMTLQARMNGVAVGDSIVLAPFETSRYVTVPVTRRGGAAYSVTTDGDGAEISAGSSGYVTVNQVGATPRLSLSAPTVATLGAPLDVTVGVAWDGNGNKLPEPTGFVRVQMLDGARTVTSCVVTLPATRCALFGPGLDETGVFRVALSYSGDERFEPAATNSDAHPLTLYRSLSRVEVSYSVPPSQWLQGQQVIATWKTYDSLSALDANRPGGTVGAATGTIVVRMTHWDRLTDTSNGLPLCRVSASAQSCMFTVKPLSAIAGPRDLAVVATTFIPDTASTPSSDATALTVSRCLPVTVFTSSRYQAAQGLGDPRVAGTPCAVPATGPGMADGSVAGMTGFREGTPVSVSAPTPMPANYRVSAWIGTQDGASFGSLFTTPNPTGTAADGPTGPGQSVTFDVHEPTTVVAKIDWAPTCVTLTATDRWGYSAAAIAASPLRQPEHPETYYNPGMVALKTMSNCTYPDGTTIEENADLARGIGHYALGTDVEVDPVVYPHARTIRDPDFVATSVVGALPIDAEHHYPHVVMDTDRQVRATYEIAPVMCTEVKLYAGIGGTVAIDRTTKSVLGAYQTADPQGRCLTTAGTPGFLAGTSLVYKATATNNGDRNGAFTDRWLGPAELATPQLAASNLGLRAATQWPDYDHSPVYQLTPQGRVISVDLNAHNPFFPQYHAVEIPGPGRAGAIPARFGASFAGVTCVPLHVKMTFPTTKGASSSPGITHTPSNCAAYGEQTYVGDSTPEPDQPDFQSYRGSTDPRMYEAAQVATYWYAPGTVVTVAGRNAVPGRKLSWAVADTAVAAAPSADISGTVQLTMGAEKWVTGAWRPSACVPARVNVWPPNMGGYTVIHGTGTCGEGMLDPTRSIELHAKDVAGLRPQWQFQLPGSSVPDQDGRNADGGQFGDGVYVTGNFAYYNDEQARKKGRNDAGASIYLTYCKTLPVTLAWTNPDGSRLNSDEYYQMLNVMRTDNRGSDLPSLVADGDFNTCSAPGSARPDSTVDVMLSGFASRFVTYIGASKNGVVVKNDSAPTVRIAQDGTVTDQVALQVVPKCFALGLPRYEVQEYTDPNCPGARGERRYLPGTIVKLSYTGKKFERWDGASTSTGRDVTVRMDSNKELSVVLSTSSGERAIAIFSAVIQRGLAVLTAVVMPEITGVLFVAQVGAYIVGGVASGLEAAGVHGAAIDTMKNAADAVKSTMDLTQALVTCTQDWATGGGGSLLTPNELAQVGVKAGGAAGQKAFNAFTTDKEGVQGGKVVTGTVKLVMSLTTNIDAYSRDPNQAWADVVNIGSCLEQAGRDTGDAYEKLGTGG